MTTIWTIAKAGTVSHEDKARVQPPGGARGGGGVMGLMISIGKWGGIYFVPHAFAPRLCLGWIAFTLFKSDGDNIIEMARRYAESIQPGEGEAVT